MSNSDEINLGGVSQVASGAGSVNQAGKNTATINVSAGPSVTFEQFVAELSKSIAVQSETQPTSDNDLNKTVFEPLKEIAASKEPDNEQDRQTLKDRIMTLVSQLEPYAPYIRKTIAAFAEGALSTLPPPASWIIAGCIEVVRDARRD